MNVDTPTTTRILVTGAGGPAAIAVIRTLQGDPSLTLMAADMDPWASGLYLVAPEQCVIVPAGDAPEFIERLLEICAENRIGILIPTVDAELEPIAENWERFFTIGVEILGAPHHVLRETLDKLTIVQKCAPFVRVPRTELATETDISTWDFPAILKPRHGSGGRGVSKILDRQDFAMARNLEGFIIQEFLPGKEYSVDVLATRDARPIAAVPRLRARVDSGVMVGGLTLCNEVLETFAKKVVTVMRIPFISNVQVKLTAEGAPSLLEVNPRVPGSLALTKAAGVDMVRYALDELRGRYVPEAIAHREVAMVRLLSDLVVEVDDLVQGAAPDFSSPDNNFVNKLPIPLSA